MQKLSKAIHGLMIGASYALLLIVGLILFTFFKPLGIVAYVAVGLYMLSLSYVLTSSRS